MVQVILAPDPHLPGLETPKVETAEKWKKQKEEAKVAFVPS